MKKFNGQSASPQLPPLEDLRLYHTSLPFSTPTPQGELLKIYFPKGGGVRGSELCRFCASSNPVCGLSEIENLWQWSWLEIRLNAFRRSTMPEKIHIIIIFKFLMWITYSVLPCKLVTSFSNFSILFFQVKMVNHYEVHVFFQDIEHRFPCYRFLWSLY